MSQHRPRAPWWVRLDRYALDVPGWVTFVWWSALLIALVILTAANGSTP